MKRSWLFYLNYCVLQWFCFRLARFVDTETQEQIGWKLMWNVKPLSGWGNKPYKKLFKNL